MHRNSTRENREAPVAPAPLAGRSEKPMRYKSETNVAGESSGCIVLTKCPNKARRLAAEGMEGRRLAKEIRRQGPELDSVPAEPGALYCQRNALIVSSQRRPYPRWEPGALVARARVCAGVSGNWHPYRDRPAPWPACQLFAHSERPTRASAADQGVRP